MILVAGRGGKRRRAGQTGPLLTSRTISLQYVIPDETHILEIMPDGRRAAARRQTAAYVINAARLRMTAALRHRIFTTPAACRCGVRACAGGATRIPHAPLTCAYAPTLPHRRAPVEHRFAPRLCFSLHIFAEIAPFHMTAREARGIITSCFIRNSFLFALRALPSPSANMKKAARVKRKHAAWSGCESLESVER